MLAKKKRIFLSENFFFEVVAHTGARFAKKKEKRIDGKIEKKKKTGEKRIVGFF